MNHFILVLSLLAVSCASSSTATSPASETPPRPTSTSASTSGSMTPDATSSTAVAPSQPPPVSSASPMATTSASMSAVTTGPTSASKVGSGPVLHLTQGKIASGDVALAAADEKIRTCLATSKNPGDVTIKITVTTSGWALSVDISTKDDVSKEALSCAKKAMRDHTFGKPVDGGVAAAIGVFHAPGM